ncbi:MAG: helix-turn-helix transcriptional regulator [Deltaproteobacteria bacterium]|nr:helix-turn-helix transcriptional regulator [Deltaproteobacteria bacterium]
MTTTVPTPFGHALRRWRTARRMSQLALATRAETPSRHVSFLETGRARPSSAMVLRLADALELPLHERNGLLTAAGFPPAFAARTLDDEALAPVRFVIARLLEAHAPYPAIVLDRWYDILDANPAGRLMFLGGAPLDPDDPPNLVDLILGPFRDRVLNWHELVRDGLARLRREAASALDDARLHALLDRVEAAARPLSAPIDDAPPSPVLLTRIAHEGRVLTTLSTLVHFGGSRDVTVDGLHLELVYPADEHTDRVLRALGVAARPPAAVVKRAVRG